MDEWEIKLKKKKCLIKDICVWGWEMWTTEAAVKVSFSICYITMHQPDNVGPCILSLSSYIALGPSTTSTQSVEIGVGSNNIMQLYSLINFVDLKSIDNYIFSKLLLLE
jgi:hypothetical protein